MTLFSGEGILLALHMDRRGWLNGVWDGETMASRILVGYS